MKNIITILAVAAAFTFVVGNSVDAGIYDYGFGTSRSYNNNYVQNRSHNHSHHHNRATKRNYNSYNLGYSSAYSTPYSSSLYNSYSPYSSYSSYQTRPYSSSLYNGYSSNNPRPVGYNYGTGYNNSLNNLPRHHSHADHHSLYGYGY